MLGWDWVVGIGEFFRVAASGCEEYISEVATALVVAALDNLRCL